jgi:hypothetical protein
MEDDGAVVIETSTAVKVDMLLPNIAIDTLRVDKVTDGIIVQVSDGEEVQCFVQLPQNVNLAHMKANLDGRQLSLLIPKQ